MSITRTVDAGDGASVGRVQNGMRWILVFAFLGTLFDGAELNLVGYPLSYISDSLHVSTLQVVQVSTLQGFASIVGGVLCGWLGDLYGRRWAYTGSVLIFGISAVLGGLAPTYGLFLLTRLIAGVGMGGLFGLSFSMFTEGRKSTRKRGVMGGSIQSMYFVGQIVTEGVVYFCTVHSGEATGWRAGYVVIGVMTIAIGLLAVFLLPESEQWLLYQRELKAGRVPPEMRRTKVPVADVFKKGYARGTLLFVTLATGLFITTNSMIAYLTTFLVKVEKVPLGTASIIVLIGLLCTAATYPLAGGLSDAIGRKKAFFWASSFGVIGFAWLLIQVAGGTAHVGVDFWNYPTFWALMLSAGAGGGFGVLGVWMAEYFPTRTRTTGSNVSYYAGRGFGAGLFPLVALALAGSVPMALALGLVGPASGALFALLVPDATGRRIEAIE